MYWWTCWPFDQEPYSWLTPQLLICVSCKLNQINNVRNYQQQVSLKASIALRSSSFTPSPPFQWHIYSTKALMESPSHACKHPCRDGKRVTDLISTIIKRGLIRVTLLWREAWGLWAALCHYGSIMSHTKPIQHASERQQQKETRKTWKTMSIWYVKRNRNKNKHQPRSSDNTARSYDKELLNLRQMKPTNSVAMRPLPKVR